MEHAGALLGEVDDAQAEAFADVIDLGQFKASIDETHTLGGNNLAAVRAVNPRGLAAHRELEAAVMAGTDTLSEPDRTLIGLIVSIENHCRYWEIHLSRRLESWFDSDRIDAFAADWAHADLPIRDRAMLAFAVKLTLIPGQMTSSDANLLTNVGFSERDLLDIVDVVSYWSFATRVVDGLGVFLEPWLNDRSTPVTD